MALNCALRLAQRAIRERLDTMVDRFESDRLQAWDRAQTELRNLRELIRTGEYESGEMWVATG